MLVLSRKLGQGLVFDSNVSVFLLKISGRRVTLGIRAPRAVEIKRSELTGPAPKRDFVQEGESYLVLSRTLGESIHIGDVVVTLVRKGGRSISLGVTAPKEILIRRTEKIA